MVSLLLQDDGSVIASVRLSQLCVRLSQLCVRLQIITLSIFMKWCNILVCFMY